jgi:hypothetical protein
VRQNFNMMYLNISPCGPMWRSFGGRTLTQDLLEGRDLNLELASQMFWVSSRAEPFLLLNLKRGVELSDQHKSSFVIKSRKLATLADLLEVFKMWKAS